MHAFWTLCSWALVTVCMRQLSTRTSKIAAHCLHFLYACMVLCPTAGSNNFESFAAGSLYYTAALQQMSQVYQCCCDQRAEKPASSRSGPTAESSTGLVNARSMEYSWHDEVCYEPPI